MESGESTTYPEYRKWKGAMIYLSSASILDIYYVEGWPIPLEILVLHKAAGGIGSLELWYIEREDELALAILGIVI